MSVVFLMVNLILAVIGGAWLGSKIASVGIWAFEKWRAKGEWRPPFKCRVFKHHFRETKYALVLFGFIPAEVEICSRCEMGRVFAIGGYQFFTPEALAGRIAKREGVAAGKVVPLKR